jgi:hypothetical protein
MMNINKISRSRVNVLEGAGKETSELITDSMEQVIEKLIVVNLNPDILYSVHKSPPLDAILSCTQPTSVFLYFFKILLILSFRLRSDVRLLPLDFLTNF